MRQLTGSADAGMERLVTGIAAVAPVAVEQAASTCRQGHSPLASVERHGPNQPLVSQVSGITRSCRTAPSRGHVGQPRPGLAAASVQWTVPPSIRR